MKWHAYALYVKKVACEIWIFEIKSLPFLPLHRKDKKAQMAESVDALVSNTSGVTSIPVRPRVWVQEKELSICKSKT